MVGEFDPVGGHGVFGDDGAECDGPFVGAFIAFDTDGFDGDEGGVGLPDFVVPAVFFEFADEDGVAFADDVEAVFGDDAWAADGEARTREGVAHEDVAVDAEGDAEFADFVFEEFGERFEDFALGLELEDAVDAVVVGFDFGGFGFGVGGAFDDVWVEGALGEHFGVADGVPEDVDEEFADDFAFFLGVGFAFEGVEEAFGGVDFLDGDAHAFEVGDDFVGFVFAHEALIDVDGADVDAGFVEEDGEDGGIDAAGDAADDLFLSDFLADVVDDFAFKVLDVEGFEVFGLSEEVAEDLGALVAVCDFGVELDAPEVFAPLEGDGGAVLVFGDDLGVFREVFHGVGVAHPDL